MRATREQPSWLQLERYAVGELSESDRAAVERALADDPASAECLKRIQSDVRLLPPLPGIERPATEAWWVSWQRWRFAAAFVTVSAILLLVLTPDSTLGPLQPVASNAGPSVKGDAVAVSLVRERAGVVALDPTVFSPEDRFKVRVTCAAEDSVVANVVVYQDGEASFPIEPQRMECGNHVVLRGAFRLSGVQPAQVCVVISKHSAIAREELELGPPATDSMCTSLIFAP